MAKLTIVRILIALASLNNWHIHQMDVKNAFLHGDLQENVYMSILDGVLANSNQVYKLQKILFGLKQASIKWYEKLTHLLIKEGYHRSYSDYSLFTLKHGSNFTIILVYVNDIITADTYLT